MNNQRKYFQPLVYSLFIALGIAIGILLRPSGSGQTFIGKAGNKLHEVMQLLDRAYVDTIDVNKLEESTITEMLTKLDPHTVYMSAEELKAANEQLDGNFVGIGVEFSILQDTIMIVAPIEGGPSIALGIQSGDRIIQVDTQLVAGVGITNEQVFKLLRGEMGTEVKVSIYRPTTQKTIAYLIKRNNIPIKSVDVAMMLDEQTGYIKVNKFAAETHKEFHDGLKKLTTAKRLIVDLRGNPGGYLSAVIAMADEVLADKKLIVYTEGRNQPRNEYKAELSGLFEKGKVVVLIDEGSASASEIFAGAIQDHDRGLIIGRRSFGKGLVQEPFDLKDGSGLRLTVSRYYTPSGRCIQKPYNKGQEAYEHEILDRYENGEVDGTIQLNSVADTVSYYTTSGRVVHGGGGITPDIFVPLDTTYRCDYINEIYAKNLIRQFATYYVDNNRMTLNNYKSAQEFYTDDHTKWMEVFVKFAQSQGVRKPTTDEIKRTSIFLGNQLRAQVARQIWKDEGYFLVFSQYDKIIQKALQSLNNPKF